jgi:hypothetical protein
MDALRLRLHSTHSLEVRRTFYGYELELLHADEPPLALLTLASASSAIVHGVQRFGHPVCERGSAPHPSEAAVAEQIY